MQSNYNRLHALSKQGNILAIATIYYLRYPVYFERTRSMIQYPLQAHLSTINMMAGAISRMTDFTSWVNMEAFLVVKSLKTAQDYLELLPKNYMAPTIEEIYSRYVECNNSDAVVDQDELQLATKGFNPVMQQYFTSEEQVLRAELQDVFDRTKIKRLEKTLEGIYKNIPMVRNEYVRAYCAFLNNRISRTPGNISTICKEVYLEDRPYHQYSIDLSQCHIEKFNYPHLTYPYIRNSLLEQWPLQLIHFRCKLPYIT